MKVVIIGSGNVAWVLGNKIVTAGHEVLEVVSRSTSHAQLLATQLNSSASNNLKLINKDADIYLVCVGDSAITEVAAEISHVTGIIAHTAGAVSKDVLHAQSYGVLYPLQSLRKEMTYVPEIPVLVDGNSEDVSKRLLDFASTWASSISFASDDERLKLHIAAVIASNFSNHLYALTEEFCKSENVSFHMLLPLINETAARLNQFSAAQLQTGPASRSDTTTISKHLEVLQAYPRLQQIYSQLSKSIIKQAEVVAK